MAKITIISGFLGAGKTTFIKKLIDEVYKGEKIVLIENEFGEIGIDGGFLKDSGIEINEMNSGCICCSLVGDFEKSLKEVLEQFSPERIIIEPSGVGKLSDVINAVLSIDDESIELESFVTVSDVKKCKMYMKNFGEFYNNQIENANTIVLSRTQNVPAHTVENAVALIQEKNHKAKIITTPWEQLGANQIHTAIQQGKSLISELIEDDHHDHDHHDHHHDHHNCGHDHHEHCDCGHDHHEHTHHHAEDVFTNWAVETPHIYEKATFKKVLTVLSKTEDYGMILRAKGIVQDENGEWIHFDLVPGEFEIRTGSASYTGCICVIGTQLDEEGLKQIFELA